MNDFHKTGKATTPFFFTIEAKPLPNNEQGKGLDKAIAKVWVFEDSMDNATTKAIRYISQHGWTVMKIDSCLAMQPEQILRLYKHRPEELENYRDAEQLGICAQFHAWPEKPTPDFYSIEPLRKPPKE